MHRARFGARNDPAFELHRALLPEIAAHRLDEGRDGGGLRRRARDQLERFGGGA